MERRETIAKLVKQAYLDDAYIGELGAQDMIQQTDLTLAAYPAKVRHNLWATLLELMLASGALEVQIAISAKGNITTRDPCPEHLIRLRHGHYM